MKPKHFLAIASLFFCPLVFAQVGIGNTNPQATLDISATNSATPSNEDGILIPRIDEFPAVNPGAAQDGMMVFVTGNGTPTEGFYYWDNGTTSWVSVGGGVDTQNTLDEAYDEGGAGTGRTITADNGAVLIQGNDGVQNTGTFGSGATLALSGAGTRMFFYPRKAAFRAGNVTATQWNDANIGDYSVAMGRSTIASGTYDVAIGFGSTASGTYSTAMGWANTASGAYSFSLGQNSTASGWSSTALGRVSTASGSQSMVFGHGLTVSGANSIGIGNNGTLSGGNSITIGNDLIAPSGYEVAVGNYNTTYVPNSTTAIDNADRLFSVGNGTSTVARSNALSIYKDGTLNINDAYNMPLADGTAGQVMTSDGAGNVTFQNASGGDDDWYTAGTTTAPTAITDNVVTQGTVTLGNDNTGATNAKLTVKSDVSSEIYSARVAPEGTASSAATRYGIYTLDSNITPSGSMNFYSMYNSLSTTHTGTAVGLFNDFSNSGGVEFGLYNRYNSVEGVTGLRNEFLGTTTGTAQFVGVENRLLGSETYAGTVYGMNNILFAEGNGVRYGVYNTLAGSGTGNKYGSYNSISSAAGGIHYGVYSQVEKATGYAGYFIGRASFGTDSTIGRYLMPTSDGTAGQVIATDGAGNLSFQNAGVDTDDQTIDVFSLTGTTLNLSLQDDGQPTQTVDLSSLQDGTGTDDQTIDVFGLAGTLLGISLENDGQPTQTVDLSSLNTDDQTIDTFSFNTSTDILTLEIEDDGVAAQTVDLSSLSDDSSWYRELTTTNSDNTTNDIYRAGSVGIGLTSSDFVVSPLYVNSATVAYPFTATFDNNTGESGIDINIENASTGVSSGINIDHNSSGASSKFGIYNAFRGTGGTAFGIRNWFLSTADYSGGGTYGVYNYLNSASGSSIQKGVYNYIDNAGTGPKYGTHTQITTTSGGTHYGLYSEVLKAGSYAGYFLGRVAIGTGAGNTYILPSSRGTNGQIMQTDAAGNVSWVTLSSGESTTASNGLTEIGDDVRLGGTLTQATTINQGNFGMTYNLTGTGDFAVQDNGSPAFIVEDTGDVGFGLTNPAYQVDIEETDNTKFIGARIVKTDNTATLNTAGLQIDKTTNGSGSSNGILQTIAGTGTGEKRGVYNVVSTTGTGNKKGVLNTFTSTASGLQYGVENQFDGATVSPQRGLVNNFTNGTDSQFGVYNVFTGTATTGEYGAYSIFNNASTSSKAANLGIFGTAADGNHTGAAYYFDGTTNTTKMGFYANFANSTVGTLYGLDVLMTTTDSGTKYGVKVDISANVTGTSNYGIYSNVNTADGWAGYFTGKNYVSENIGINNPSPDGRLDIIHNSTGATSPHIMLTAENANTGARIVFDNETETTNNWVLFARADDTSTDSRFNIFHNGTGNIMVVTGDGKVGINRTPATNALEVNGDASKTTAGAWAANSDRRLKKEITSISGKSALDKIQQMRGVTYLWNDTQTGIKRPENLQYGFIAQELMEVFPEKVTMDNLGYYQTAYGDYDPIFVEAIKELKLEVDTLKEENDSLKKLVEKYKNLEARLSALEDEKEILPSETANTAEER
ncbi:MAG: tail fiber domain-containing protein [Flavobacteriaceae bacterium]